MSESTIVEILFRRTWWTYGARGNDPWFEVPYHAFNLFEGAAWVVFAGLVGRRYLRHRRSPLEVAYALAFAAFGLTDFIEAYALSSWLVWIKLANLVALAQLRSVVVRRCYPASRW